ncbi:MAG: hypothetical protein HXY45_08555 [Syntrophaceae bacterium]|nr:hypothetical protein [Syntrophaceae bacterium]
MPATLEKAHERLNLMDPSAGNRLSANRCLLLHRACVILVLLFPRISLDPVEVLPKLLQQWGRIF